VIDPAGQMRPIFPNNYSAGESATRLKAGETLQIPNRNRGDRFRLPVRPPLGTVEMLVIASTKPLRNTLRELQKIANRGQKGLGDEPTDVINSILGDLNRGARGNEEAGGVGVELDQSARGVSATQLAALSITFQSVE
jgi:Domain of unknown function (DUF4384)